jgi:hypothetical protein
MDVTRRLNFSPKLKSDSLSLCWKFYINRKPVEIIDDGLLHRGQQIMELLSMRDHGHDFLNFGEISDIIDLLCTA